jgi:hypothetical protein
LVLVLFLVVLAAACSSASSPTAPPPTTAQTAPAPSVPPGPLDDVFKAKADIACQAVGKELKQQGAFPFPDFDPEHPDVSRFPQIAAYEAQTVAAEKEWQTRMHAIGSPKTGQAEWLALLHAVDLAVDSTSAQQQAAARGDAAAFKASYQDLTNHATAGTNAAIAAGLPSCDPSNLGG